MFEIDPLFKPDYGSPNWHIPVNANFTAIDSFVAEVAAQFVLVREEVATENTLIRAEFKTIPRDAFPTSNYTLQPSNVGKGVYISGGSLTVPANVFVRGDVIILFNDAATNRPVVQGSGLTLFWFGGVTGNRTLLPRALATVYFISPTVAVITGQGVI